MRIKGMEREWIIAPAQPLEASTALAEALGLPRVGAEILLRRGVDTAESARGFLDPRLRSLHDPLGLPDMARAAERAWQAIDRGETILVHGDYDVDGMVGTAFLVRLLTALGGRLSYFLPERLKDGYGIGPAGLAACRERGATLMLAVDCGITAVDLADQAAAAGVDLVILDHHQPPPVLPRAVAVVDALRADATYPFTGLCGVGVAAKFLQAMAMMRPGTLDPALYVEALQLVALGTIADVVPLVDENRTFVVHGLKALSASEWPGILALKRLARLSNAPVSAGQVAFQLAPRLNAAGRMGCASLGVELLLADSIDRGEFLAARLEEQNLLRREADQKVSAMARARAEAEPELPAFLVYWDDDWSPGVIGIAAARVAEEFRRPTLLIGLNGEIGRGSARSYAGLDVGAAFAAAGDLLVAHGGHRQAAGLSVHRDRLGELREWLIALAEAGPAATEEPPLTLDGELRPDEVDGALLRFLDKLAPFGAGSPEPLFLLRDLPLVGAPRIVGNDHLKLTVEAGGRPMAAIGFGLGRHAEQLAASGRRATLAATPSPDEWRGGGAIQLKFRDVQAAR